MFNIFMAGVAVTAVSCSKTTFLEAPEAVAIRFDNAFVSRMTKAELTSTSISSFNVFCQTSEKDQPFNDTEVTRNSGTWEYSDTRYWDYGQSYAFSAYAPSEASDAISNISHDWKENRITFDYNSDDTHQYDLVVANTVCSSQKKAVELEFEHEMSILCFEFISQEYKGITFNLKSLKVSGICTSAWFNGESFENPADPGTYSALPEGGVVCSAESAVASREIYVIPQSLDEGSVTMELSLDATDEFGNILTYNDALLINLPAADWEPGSTYVVTTDLDVNMVNPEIKVSKIEFSVDVEDWKDVQ